MLREGEGCVPGLPVIDAIKSVENGQIVESLERTNTWRIQTPQGFRFDQNPRGASCLNWT